MNSANRATFDLEALLDRARVPLHGLAHNAFRLRPADSTDFPFAWSLYRELMQPLSVELRGRRNETGQKHVVELALAQEETSIIVIDELDAGWLQVSESEHKLKMRWQETVTPFPSPT